MSSVFVATDLSPAADEAILQAHEQAEILKAQLIVCYVLPTLQPTDPFFPEWDQQLSMKYEEVREHFPSMLSERVKSLTQRNEGAFSIVLGEGDAATFIVHKAEELDARLLVVGSYGSSGLVRILVGSVADRVIRHAHCPVLLARQRQRAGIILVATDFSDPSLPAVAAAAEQAHKTGSRLAILHCLESIWPFSASAMSIGQYLYIGADATRLNEIRSAIYDELGNALSDYNIDGDRIIKFGPADEAIVSSAEELGAQLVVIGSVGKTGLRRLLMGSVAERVTRNAPCSVMIVRLHRST